MITPLLCMFILSARETHLNSRERGDDGGGAEAMRDEAKVGEVPLDRRVEDLVGPRVAQRRAVLVQQVHQLLCDNSARRSDKMSDETK